MSKLKQFWALRYVLGTLIAVALAGYLFIWALGHYPLYVGIGIALLVVVVIAMQPRIRRERKRIQGLIDAAFQEAYAQLPSPPSIQQSSSYGYPYFEVKFRSKAECQSATAMNESFKAAIGRIFQGFGPRSRPFNAEQATFFTFDGHLKELAALSRTASEATRPR